MNAKFRKSWARALMALSLAMTMVPAAAGQSATAAMHESHEKADAKKFSPALINRVRSQTLRYLDVNAAMHDGWVPATPCVSGPQEGAMGVHFVLPSRLGDGILNPDEPEALIYEPMPNGAMRLVGAEFIVFAADWANQHPEGGAPSVDGHLANYVAEPNRYGLHAFYELHVWAWEHNPGGTFADWNVNVSCDNQPGE